MPLQRVITNLDDFISEAGMLPDLSSRPIFAITNPLEQHFMEVADKHGIIDEILDPDFDQFEP